MKKDNFYNLLEQHAGKVYEAYEKMAESLQENNRDEFEKILFLEREADDLRRILIERLNKALVTPFDREDIFALSRAVDDIIDAAKSTVEEIDVFKVEPTDELVNLVNTLKMGTLEIYDAIKNMKKHPTVALEHAKRAKATENQMNHLYLDALARLFEDKNNPYGYMMKMREIYRHLNRSADRCDEAANIISNIIIKT